MPLQPLAASSALVELAEEVAARGAAVIVKINELAQEQATHKQTQEKLATATARVAELEQELKKIKDDATLEVVVTDMTEARSAKAKKAE